MATAIFLGAIIVSEAVRGDRFLQSKPGGHGVVLLMIFVAYDLLRFFQG